MSWTAASWAISINSLTFISLPLLTPTTTPATHTSRHKWAITGQRSCWWKLPGPPGFYSLYKFPWYVCITSAFRDKPEKYFTLFWYRKQVENRFLRHCKRLFYCDTSRCVVMVLNSYSVISEVLTVHLNLWTREYVCAVRVIRQNALFAAISTVTHCSLSVSARAFRASMHPLHVLNNGGIQGVP